MSYDNGKITAPVTTRDVQKALGTTENRQSALSTHENINKYSIIKPIAYPTNGERCPNFKGSLADNVAGYYYGLKVGDGMSWGTGIHSADWEYVSKPTGEIGVAPYRRLDFDGYDQNARPTMMGQLLTIVPNKVVYTHQTPFEFNLEWNAFDNTTGIDIRECYQGSTPFSSLYFCVAVGSYHAVMLDENGFLAPIGEPNAAGVRFKCPEFPDQLKTAIDSIAITFFVADLTNSAQQEMRDMINGEWVKFDDGHIGDTQAITIPEAVNLQVELTSSAIDYGVVRFLDVQFNTTKRIILAELEFTTKPDTDRNYMFYFDIPEYDRLAISLYGGTNKGDFTVEINPTDMGIKIGLEESYTYSASIYGYDAGIMTDNPLAQMSGTLVI